MTRSHRSSLILTALAAVVAWSTLGAVSLGAQSGSAVGGKNLMLTGFGNGLVQLDWTPGTVQSGYNVLRLGSAGVVAVGSLGANTASYSETVPPSEGFVCYGVTPLSGGNVIGLSDVLCLQPRFAVGNSPTKPVIRLNQTNTATVNWSEPPAPGPTDYLFVPLGTNRLQSLPLAAFSASDDSGGVLTCYVVGAFAGPTLIGYTDAVCALPGLSFGLTVPTATPTGLATLTATTVSSSTPTPTSTTIVTTTTTATPLLATATLTPSPTRTGTSTLTPSRTATPSSTTAPDSWLARAPISVARGALASAAGPDGKIYAIGGANGCCNFTITTTEEYDPAANLWRARANMPTGRSYFAAAQATNGKIYAAGGITSSNYNSPVASFEELDPATNTWTTRAPMPTARWALALAAAPNGKIYAIGGQNGLPVPSTVVATVEEYDPATNTWATRAPMSTPRSYFGAATATNGKIYVAGGHDGNAVVASAEEYDPNTNSWTTRASMPVLHIAHGVVALSNGRVYAVGAGAGDGRVDEYDPNTSTWTQRASMILATHNRGIAANGTNIYAMGGCCDASTAEMYTPLTFTTGASSPQAPANSSASIPAHPLAGAASHPLGRSQSGP